MGLIKEPVDIDFIVDSRPLTEVEKSSISEFIRADKEKREQKKLSPKVKLKRLKFTQPV